MQLGKYFSVVMTLALLAGPLLAVGPVNAATNAPDLVIEKLSVLESNSQLPQKTGYAVLGVQYRNSGTAAVSKPFDFSVKFTNSDAVKAVPQLESYTVTLGQDGAEPVKTSKFVNTKKSGKEFTGSITKLNPAALTDEAGQTMTLNKYDLAVGESSVVIVYVPQDAINTASGGLKLEVNLNPKKKLIESNTANNRKTLVIANTKAADLTFGTVQVDLEGATQFPQVPGRVLVAVPYKNVGQTKVSKSFTIVLRTTPKLGKKDNLTHLESVTALTTTEGTQSALQKKFVTLSKNGSNEFTAKINKTNPVNPTNGTVVWESTFNKYNLAPGETSYALFYLPATTIKALGGLTLSGKIVPAKNTVEGNTTNNSFSVVVGNPAEPQSAPESDYLTYANPNLEISFTYPAKFGTVDFYWVPGETGKKFIGKFSKVDMQFGGATPDFTAGMGVSFLLFNDASKISTWGEPEEYVKILTSGSGVKTQLLHGKTNPTSMDILLEGERGALVALKKSPNYPVLAFKVGVNTGVNNPEFEQMLETIAVEGIIYN